MAAIPLDLLDRIRTLERQVRELTGRAQMRPAMNEVLNGSVTVGDGGSFTVKSPDGVRILNVGRVTPPAGGEYALQIKRRDGSDAISLYNGTDKDEAQVLRLQDSRGNILLAEDVKAGGLYGPAIPYPDLQPDALSSWPSTTSTSWTTLLQGNAIAQHPRVAVFLTMALGATAQQLRLQINDQVVVTGASNSTVQTIVEVPGFSFNMGINFKVDARVTSGTGSVGAAVRYLYGVGSA